MKTGFVPMLLVALSLVGYAQQGPAQQQHAPSGASTASASAAVPLAEHLTLWGITVGAPAPAWPKCTGKNGTAASDDRACLQSTVGEVHMLNNLVGDAKARTAVTTRAGVVDSIQIQTNNNETCRQVVPTLTKNLGEPVHTTRPVQNGSGPRWDADIYRWQTADGSEAELFVHTRHQEGCNLQASSAAHVARYGLGDEIMELLIERETSLADSLDALTMVMVNALRAHYGDRDEFSRFYEQVSRFPEPAERDRTANMA